MKMEDFPDEVFLSGKHGNVPGNKLNRATMIVIARNVDASKRGALRSLANEMDVSHSTVDRTFGRFTGHTVEFVRKQELAKAGIEKELSRNRIPAQFLLENRQEQELKIIENKGKNQNFTINKFV